MMLTIIEMPEFQKRSKNCLDDQSLQDLIEYLAINPEAGDLIQGTGGIRKIRWSESGKGKRGGSRAIYYYHSHEIPLYMITIFKKNEKINLTQNERNELYNWVQKLKHNIGE